MRFSAVPVSLAALLAASLGQAQYLINELSFGHSGRLSPQESPGHIPNFVITGQPSLPELLSNKIILTPVAPGNYRGAIWSEKTLQSSSFTADVDFRVNGPERAGGNFNIWLAHDGAKVIRTRSVYNAGRFDGLVLVVDTHGGSGMLRGFLNAGDVDYTQHHNVDQLAFGHCPFAYRNLGRPAQIKIRQTPDIFRVEIDGKLCFESNKIKLPTGYNFGITASTPDTPDSFEVFKVVVMSESSKSDHGASDDKKVDSSSRQQQVPKNTNNNNNNKDNRKDESFNDNIPDADADTFQTSKTQFQDLHNRLQSTGHSIASIYRAVSKHHQMDEQRHSELKDTLKEFQNKLAKLDQVSELQRRIDSLENEVHKMRTELGQKIIDNERAFRGVLGNHHASLTQKMVDSVPGHGRLIFVIIGAQVFMVAAYVLYKRRKANSPKKYL